MADKMSIYQQRSVTATSLLRLAIQAERSRRWREAVHRYQEAIKLVLVESLPIDFIPPPGYQLTLYEMYSHLGWALQKCNEDQKAVVAYSRAMDAMARKKDLCTAGCRSNSSFQTPMHAKRAFAYCRLDKREKAMMDIDAAVAIDYQNTDIHCLRALINTTFDNYSEAQQDIQRALRFNSEHKGTGLVLDALQRQKEEGRTSVLTGKASVHSEGEDNLKILSLAEKQGTTFIDKYLFSLNVPHTTNQISIVPTSIPNAIRMYGGTEQERSILDMQLNSSSSTCMLTGSPSSNQHSRKGRPRFLCGCPGNKMKEFVAAEKQKRRASYSDALRTYITVNTPISSEQYFKSIQSKQHQQEFDNWKIRREVERGRANRKLAQVPIAVFQKINVEGAPRIYARPWKGDKIQPAKLKEYQKTPVFL